MRIPVIKEVNFVLKKVKTLDDDELLRRAWVVGMLAIIIGLIGFIVHIIMTII